MFFLEKLSLGEGFKRYFSITPAVHEAQRSLVYRIRHEVYCEELKYEPERPNREESDEYDRHSLHCLMQSSDGSGTLVGCTRLVVARPEDPFYPLPVERTCAETIDHSLYDPHKIDRKRVAEVSRLAVRAAYRRRKGEKSTDVAIRERDFGTKEHPRFPYIPVGLYLGTIAMAERCGIDTLLVLTEPRLASHFAKLGVEIKQIGGPVEHRGKRVPSMMHVPRIIKGLRFFVRPLYKTIAAEIERGYAEPSRALPQEEASNLMP